MAQTAVNPPPKAAYPIVVPREEIERAVPVPPPPVRMAQALADQLMPSPEPKDQVRKDQKQCPRCHHWGCPVYGRRLRSEGVERYRECVHCGHRMLTRQRHGSDVEEVVA